MGLFAGAATLASDLRLPPKTICAAPPVTSPIYDDVHEQIAQTSRGPIAYYRFGRGSPVVLVTGFRATLSEWNARFLAELAKHNEVVVFDNRGVGRSIPDASDFSARDMANDTASLIQALKLGHPTVVGWSMGGIVVQQLAIDDPASIAQMVLLSTLAPGKSGIPVRPHVEAMLSGAPGVTFDDVMSVLFPPASLSSATHCFRREMYEPADYRSPVISNAVTNGQSALLKAWSQDGSAAKALLAVRVITLILSGSDDDVVSVRNSNALRNLLPNTRLVTIGRAGHAMMYQFPVALAQKISAFAKP
ncbi:MAG: alpha/beta hydrolase [Methylovirgula sp.]|uniref:alpha/beta fold hydrolase n=1 Tax=Methylovirgula sp. TaxID=1978224 RepID=UPI003075F806